MIQKYLNASSHVWILHRDHHMLDTHVQNSESLHAPPVKLEKHALRAGAAAHCFARSCDLIVDIHKLWISIEIVRENRKKCTRKTILKHCVKIYRNPRILLHVTFNFLLLIFFSIQAKLHYLSIYDMTLHYVLSINKNLKYFFRMQLWWILTWKMVFVRGIYMYNEIWSASL